MINADVQSISARCAGGLTALMISHAAAAGDCLSGAMFSDVLRIETGGTPVNVVAADLDGSEHVEFSDLLELLSSWGHCAGCPANLDGDLSVGFSDLLLLLSAWGACPE